MTPEQIQRLRELEAKATEGPWEGPRYDDHPEDEGWHSVGPQPRGHTFVSLPYNPRAEEDSKLLVEARNALPELLDDWERMREHLTNLIGRFWPGCPDQPNRDEQLICCFCGCRLYGSSQGHEEGCEWAAAIKYAEEARMLY